MINPLETSVLELLQRAANEMNLHSDINESQRLSDLSIDSMKLVEVVFELEKAFNLEVPEEALGRVQTVRDLIDVVQQSVPGGSDFKSS